MHSHTDLRNTYMTYFTDTIRQHVQIEPAPLVLQNDATTLFTSSGMQPLVPYLSGREKHLSGTRLVDIQPCIRTQDIDEVGDMSHTTFFEMMGNWSLGDYTKEEQLTWMWEFLTEVLHLPKERLYITVFEGSGTVARDDEAIEIWKGLGVPADHIFAYGVKSNWWSRSGPPDSMPAGEIGGPSSEVFYDFGQGEHNGPESDEKRFLEIGNAVFIQYCKEEDGTLTELPQKNVDFGGGLERILAACDHQPDVFLTSLFTEVMASLAYLDYAKNAEAIRVIADHSRAAVFLLADGVVPSNKEHGYVLRRLLRRAGVKLYQLDGKLSDIAHLVKPIMKMYDGIYFKESDASQIQARIEEEMTRFSKTLEKGMRQVEKTTNLDGAAAFDLFQSYGFPFELTQELAAERGIEINRAEFEDAQNIHRDQSRTASAGKFKGGLAETSDQVVKYHTATHLLQQALKDLYGNTIRQEGSNITQERLRFDTNLDHKPTDEEIQKIELIVNEKIQEALPVRKIIMARQEAGNIGAAAFFREKYGDEVSVYYIGGTEGKPETAYSKELCGGPHVQNTADIGPVEIFKTEKTGTQSVRLYARQKGLS